MANWKNGPRNTVQSLRVPPDTKQRMAMAAKRERMSIQDFGRRALLAAVEKSEAKK